MCDPSGWLEPLLTDTLVSFGSNPNGGHPVNADVTRPNRVHLRYGSQVRFTRLNQAGYPLHFASLLAFQRRNVAKRGLNGWVKTQILLVAPDTGSASPEFGRKH